MEPRFCVYSCLPVMSSQGSQTSQGGRGKSDSLDLARSLRARGFDDGSIRSMEYLRPNTFVRSYLAQASGLPFLVSPGPVWAFLGFSWASPGPLWASLGLSGLL